MRSGKQVITSEAMGAELSKDPTDIWATYNHGGPITQRQVAHLLNAYDIVPDTVHPTGRSDYSPKGYKLAQFADAFARYLPNDPHIRTQKQKTLKQKRKTLKRKRRRK